MLDPLTALGLVSNIIQLIGFTTDIIHEAQGIVRSTSGNSASCESIVKLARQHRETCRAFLATPDAVYGLQQDVLPGNVREKEYQRALVGVKELAIACATETENLVVILESIAVPTGEDGRRRIGPALWAVTRLQMKRKIIAISLKKLEEYQKQLDTKMLQLVRLEAQIQAEGIHNHIRQGDVTLLEAISAAHQDFMKASENSGSEIERFVQELREREKELSQKLEASRKENGTIESILRSLEFQEIRSRWSAIPDAHRNTFHWVLHAETSPLQAWLQSPRDLFWISGNAGSGKSTLMKFMMSGIQRARAESLLQIWAGEGKPLTVIDLYFWYLGTHLQKSEDGLLRSLLCQILRSSHRLVKLATPARWAMHEKALEHWTAEDYDYVAGGPWTTNELLEALERIADSAVTDRFAVFIDGLDEYDADHARLVQLVRRLSKSPVFKFCVSSRPWNVFENAFGTLDDMFSLHDLTMDDIRSYLYDELEQGKTSQPEMQKLIEELVTKSQGVFIWVYLATKSIREGLEEGDSIQLLRERAKLLPTDLTEYFDLILSRIHPVYKSLTATALALSLKGANVTQDRFVLTDAHRQSFLNYWLLEQGFQDGHFALEQQTVDISRAVCSDMVTSARKFVNKCCKDLLWVPKRPYATDDTKETYITLYKVQFLHRTVYEFLSTRAVQTRISGAALPVVQDGLFDQMLVLSRLKCVPFESGGRCIFLKEGMEELCQAIEKGGCSARLISELDRVARRYLDHCQDSSCSSHDEPDLLKTLVSHQQYSFATAVLRLRSQIAKADLESSVQDRALLRAAIGLREDRKFPLDRVPVSFMEAYLAEVVDVNQQRNFASPWDLFIAEWNDSATSIHDAAHVWTLAKIFLAKGADLKGHLHRERNGRSISRILVSVVPLELQHELRAMLTEVEPPRPPLQSAEDQALKEKQRAEEEEAYYLRTGFRP